MEPDRVSCILSIDIGTTYLKCSLFDLNLITISSESLKIEIINPQEGFLEIDPDQLIQLVLECAQRCIAKSKVTFVIKTIGISTQRNSFLIWNKKSGKKYSNLILWSDKRVNGMCETVNKSISLKALKFGAGFLSLFVNNHRFESLKRYMFTCDQVSVKLHNLLANIKATNQKDSNNLCYGCIETWILWKLTKEKHHFTDITCASATGFYDPYYECWSGLISWLAGLSDEIYPQIQDTCFKFGTIDKDLLGVDHNLTIDTIIGDAQASIIAECAFNVGDFVITMGTGAFLSVNIGDKPLASHNGAYPLVGFKFKNDKIYILHSNLTNCGTLIEWAKEKEIFVNFSDMDELLRSVPHSDELTFKYRSDEFSDNFARIKETTKHAHFLRAIVDFMVMSIKEKYDIILKDLKLHKIKINSVKICGGVSQSNFICQYLADVLSETIERSSTSAQSSSIGAAFCAGLGKGIYATKEDLLCKRKNLSIFKPQKAIDHIMKY